MSYKISLKQLSIGCMMLVYYSQSRTRSYKKNSSVNLRWILLRQKNYKGILGQKFWRSKIQRRLTLELFYRIGSR